MHNFKSEDSFNIKGRGKVFAIKNETDSPINLAELVGKEVIIDDKVYTVKGYECFRTLNGCIMHTGTGFALLVDEED